MRPSTATTTPVLVLALIALCAAPSAGTKLNGTLEVGDISLEQDTGDRSVMQETFNIFNGFTVSRVLLDGAFNAKSAFTLDLRDINLESRQGLFDLRGEAGTLTARYDQYRYIFDPDGSVQTKRKDLRIGARFAPMQWLWLSADYDRQTRKGDRLDFPPDSLQTNLGTRYDYRLQTGRFEAEARRSGRGLAVAYDLSRFTDDAHTGWDRRGDVASARVYGADFLVPDYVTHYLRGAIGRQRLLGTGLRWDLKSLQYVGVLRPERHFRFKYGLNATRVDDTSTRLKTDDIRNNFDLTWYSRCGQVFGGYTYMTLDDDRTLTRTNAWRAGFSGSWRDRVQAKLSYASADKKDQEELTLLKDIEQSRLRASLQVLPLRPLTLGASFANRTREFPLIGVRSQGWRVTGFGRVDVAGWATFDVDYSYARDKYDDLAGAFNASSNIVTGRVDVNRLRALTLSAGVTYLDIGHDLDIEKSILSFEGRYQFLDRYHVSVKYNIYNYDDYILLDRYYTANVIWVNVGYDFSLD